MQDYPMVFVLRVDILPIPEVLDYWSEEAAAARLTRAQPGENRLPGQPWELVGINRTPEVASAYASEAVQNYLRALESHEGQEVAPDKLAPPLKPDGYFRWAHPIPGSGLYVSLSEAEPDSAGRICQVVFHCKGPNLGSAGGPTLQALGPVAAIQYQGRFLWPAHSGSP
jgi:hypothetical protein